MRLFELLLFLTTIGLLALSILLRKERRSAPMFIASGIAALVMVIHWTIEGYRIQLLLSYGIAIIFLAISGYGYFRKSAPQKLPRFLSGTAYTAMAILLAVTGGLLYAFPVFKLPAPTGEFQVGTQTFHFVDTHRNETFAAAKNGKRELMVQLWYPAQAPTGKYAPMIPDTRILGYMAAEYGLPGFTFQHLKYVSSHSYAGAKVSSVQPFYPLILANPGNGSSRFLHTSQAEELASHGYIVAVIDHTYNTFATELPDGQITTNTTKNLFSPEDDYETGRESRDQLGKVLTDDVTFTLDQLQLIQSGQLPSPLQGKLDLAHIGVFGHSIGGATSYDAAYDPRITVGIDLDGGLYGLHDGKSLRKPFLFITSESYFHQLQRVMEHQVYTDAEIEQMGSTREWEEQVAEDKKLELDRMRATIGKGGQVLYIANTEHLNFTDVQFVSPVFSLLGVTGKIVPERASTVVNACMLDFFDMYLKDRDGALMKGTDRRFPEVKLVTPLL
ncbi:alpha/beta hydrolase family protein [Paenibacillus sp. Z6-24]